ncbi:MAG: hypothetical protein WHT06_01690 [Desulfobacterales bacterium]
MSAATSCGQCKFWVETGGTDEGLVGECRHHAPSPGLIDGAGGGALRFAVWPVTRENDWCGRFEERGLANHEILERVALIEKMEAERKARAR